MASQDELTKKTKDLKIKSGSFINILLLGETGVGKSTFINSIANYLTFQQFKVAKEKDLITLIPLKCQVQDKNGVYHTIQTGSEDDKNECLETGMSATQDVKSYVFPIWNGSQKVRLIDTPGVGDGRGIDQDNINCDNILNYIGQLHELHAICYLFKPTSTRLTVYFDYCMTQILSRLDKSASENIIFIFTNTRGTNYGPGDTLPSLEKILEGIKSRPPYVTIPLKNNIFSFDNEAFRYLVAVKQGIEFDNSVQQRNCESWRKSVEQCKRLVTYIVGDGSNPPLKPHFVKSTSAINEARRLIMQLSQPLAEISQLISDNLYALERHEGDLDVETSTLDELKKKLYMPVNDLAVTKLPQPATICTNRGCAEIYKVGDIYKYHYKQRCHDPCYLTNVAQEIVGSPQLINCAAIDSSTRACKKCLCNYSLHMHIYYMTKTVNGQIVDNNVKQNIDNKEKVLDNVKNLIEDISKRKMELEKEHSIIIKACAKFAHFLQNNAITPFSDSYKEYINYLITREQSLGVQSKMSVIYYLKSLLKEYDETKESFDKALELQKKVGEDVLITPQKIQDTILELYNLKHNGKKIKELYECQKKARAKEHKNAEYIHEILAEIKLKGKKKEKDSKIANKKTFFQKNQTNKGTSGYQRNNNNQQRERSKSQTRYNMRDHSPPPPYQPHPLQAPHCHRDRSQSPHRDPPYYQQPAGPRRPPRDPHQNYPGPYAPQDPRYHQEYSRYPPQDSGYPGYARPPQEPQYSTDRHGSYNYPREGRYPNYQHPGNPASPHPQSSYDSDSSAPGHDYRPNPYPYDTRGDSRDRDRPVRERKMEFKLTVDCSQQRPDFVKGQPPTCTPPPQIPPPFDVPPYVPPSQFPPRESYPEYYPPPPRSHYENPQHFSNRPHSNYPRQNTNVPRSDQYHRQQPNRPYRQGYTKDSGRGRRGYRGGRGQRNSNQKFKNVNRKNKNQSEDSDSD